MPDSIQALNNDELRELYRTVILDHAKHPRHFGSLDSPTHVAEGINPLCGDRLRLELSVDDARIIRDAAFDGSGCAISMASASLLTETVIGLPETDALAWFEDVTARFRGEPGARVPARKKAMTRMP